MPLAADMTLWRGALQATAEYRKEDAEWQLAKRPMRSMDDAGEAWFTSTQKNPSPISHCHPSCSHACRETHVFYGLVNPSYKSTPRYAFEKLEPGS